MGYQLAERITPNNIVICSSPAELMSMLSAFESDFRAVVLKDDEILYQLAKPEAGIEFLLFYGRAAS
jgi:hypothetical protein